MEVLFHWMRGCISAGAVCFVLLRVMCDCRGVLLGEVPLCQEEILVSHFKMNLVFPYQHLTFKTEGIANLISWQLVTISRDGSFV